MSKYPRKPRKWKSFSKGHQASYMDFMKLDLTLRDYFKTKLLEADVIKVNGFSSLRLGALFGENIKFPIGKQDYMFSLFGKQIEPSDSDNLPIGLIRLIRFDDK